MPSGGVTPTDGSSGIPAGSSFPAAPATGQQYFRTDLGLAFYYDGTHWLTINQYARTLWTTPSTSAVPSSGIGVTVPPDFDLWVETLVATVTASPNNGSNYWTGSLTQLATNGTPTLIGSTFNTSAAPSATYVSYVATVGAAVHGATNPILSVSMVATGTPGQFTALFAVRYRMIGV